MGAVSTGFGCMTGVRHFDRPQGFIRQGQGKGQGEHAARSGQRGQVHPPPHRVHQRPRDGQAKARAVNTARRAQIALNKRVKHARLLRVVDPDTGIGDADDQIVLLRAQADADLPPAKCS